MKQIPSKIKAKFEVHHDASNEFVYHKNDRRNRHGVSFKVCKNREDGALLRPKLPPKYEGKEHVHSTLLNENNAELNHEKRRTATKMVFDEYNRKQGKLVFRLFFNASA